MYGSNRKNSSQGPLACAFPPHLGVVIHGGADLAITKAHSHLTRPRGSTLRYHLGPRIGVHRWGYHAAGCIEADDSGGTGGGSDGSADSERGIPYDETISKLAVPAHLLLLPATLLLHPLEGSPDLPLLVFASWLLYTLLLRPVFAVLRRKRLAGSPVPFITLVADYPLWRLGSYASLECLHIHINPRPRIRPVRIDQVEKLLTLHNGHRPFIVR